MSLKLKLWTPVLLAATTLFVGTTQASLLPFQTFIGNYGVSSDGFGSTSNSGSISAEVPAGATVKAAYLYSATYDSSSTLGTVTLGGNSISTWDQEYVNPIPPTLPNYFRTGRKDVTSIIAPIINGGLGGIYNFSITESLGNTDGEALIVVYELASLPESTVAILDGGAALGGDSTAMNFSAPLDTTDPAFFAEMRLGISFSCCSQKSNVTVNGLTLTNNAGNNDDGAQVANGSLLTMGGFDDDLLNPNDYINDDERYNLAPFIANGDTSINIFTNNPSNDDNIFVALFHAKGKAGINEPPPTTGVPEPSMLSMLGLGIVLLVAGNRLARRTSLTS